MEASASAGLTSGHRVPNPVRKQVSPSKAMNRTGRVALKVAESLLRTREMNGIQGRSAGLTGHIMLTKTPKKAAEYPVEKAARSWYRQPPCKGFRPPSMFGTSVASRSSAAAGSPPKSPESAALAVLWQLCFVLGTKFWDLNLQGWFYNVQVVKHVGCKTFRL